jgi:adenylosuccinate lyase
MSNVCPLDFRYGRDHIKKLFSEEGRLRHQLLVEAALARAHASLGTIPDAAAREISEKASLEHVDVKRVGEIEREIHHDVMAMVKALAEQCDGEAGNYVHLGATSYDIVDSANALQIQEALDIIHGDLRTLQHTLMELADRYQDTVMLGRTHGQAALPVTFGLKMAVFASEVSRHARRIADCRREISVGKMAGAVGTGAGFGERFFMLQERVMQELGLEAELPATQIVGRDRYIRLLSAMANIAASMEKFATEIRNLQRTEIGEAAESFGSKQVGSSTMPHKKNPIACEQICGLARMVRAQLLPAWENAVQWHERDLCNSSSERFIVPHALVLSDWILFRMNRVFSALDVHPDRMAENIERSQGLPLAEAVMLRLVDEGMGRQEAHELLRRCSLEALESGRHLREVLMENSAVRSHLDEKDITRALDAAAYVGAAPDIVRRTLSRLSEELEE